jgi:hypothetical protein
MIARLLPPEEWSRLAGTDLEAHWPHFNPAQTDVMVVEHEGQIIGCLSMLKVFHVEGLWIAEAHRRKGAVMRHLLELMQATAETHDTRGLVAGAITQQMRDVLAGLGASALPDQFVIPVSQGKPCLH